MEPTNIHVTSPSCRHVQSVLARIGDKWAVLVVRMLSDGSVRFSDLRRGIDGISQRMLTLTLRGLERDGLVRRTVHPTVPPRVDYELTPLGRSLQSPINALGDWAFAHQTEMTAARERFDRDHVKDTRIKIAASRVEPLRVAERAESH